MKSRPLVSIVILNWNGRKRLGKCLASLDKTTYLSKEIVVVNNGSMDDSAIFLKKKYPKVKVIELKKNVGYARGKNIGVAKAKGKYVLALDNDTVVTPNFLESLVDIMERDKSIGIIQPQIRSMINREVLDSVGSYLTNTGFLYHFGYLKPYKLPIYNKTLFPYSIKGAGFMIRRLDYLKLRGLDEDFKCYVEETDLCHRMWLFGKKVMYYPDSVIYHYGGGDSKLLTKDELTMFRSYRNRIMSYLKNLSIKSLLIIMPIHLVFCEAFVVMTLFHGMFKRALWVQAGIIEGFLQLPKIIKKRHFIQKRLEEFQTMS